MKNIVLIAPPAAGKGTQSNMLVEKYQLTHISTGDLLRNIDPETDLGKLVNSIMAEGKLVSDDVLLDVLRNRFKEKNYENGFILDGTPRNLNQAKLLDIILDAMHMELNYAIFLDISEELAMSRALGRLNCSGCEAIYHKTNMPPKVEGICDKCGAKLELRSDDTEETFKKRYQTYIENTKPVLEYYQNQNKLFVIPSSESKEETFKAIEKVINNG